MMSLTAADEAALSRRAYDPIWKTIHWLMAALFLLNVGLGYYASTLAPGAGARPALLEFHKSIGVTLFGLVIVRLLWRLTHRHAPLPKRLGPATRFASSAVHLLLYVLMLGMPLSGYVDSIAGGHPFRWFGLFPFPDFLPRDKALSNAGDTAHWIGAYAVYALVTLHIVAAVWHGIKRDGVLSRMT